LLYRICLGQFRDLEVDPMKTVFTATIAVVALSLIPAAGSAHDGFFWPAELPKADEQTGCPMLHATQCPAAAGIKLSHLATAAEQGCPYSTTRLIEQARRCTDEQTAGLARRAAAGDDEAKTELIRRIRSVMPVAPGRVDPGTAA
jgi:hypothetical protein